MIFCRGEVKSGLDNDLTQKNRQSIISDLKAPKHFLNGPLLTQIYAWAVLCLASKMGTLNTVKSGMTPIILFAGAHVSTNLRPAMTI